MDRSEVLQEETDACTHSLELKLCMNIYEFIKENLWLF